MFACPALGSRPAAHGGCHRRPSAPRPTEVEVPSWTAHQTLNVTKTEGLRCGSLKGKECTGPGTEGIAWCKPGECIISLGHPFAEDRAAIESFYEAKYNKMKCLLACWHAISPADVVSAIARMGGFGIGLISGYVAGTGRHRHRPSSGGEVEAVPSPPHNPLPRAPTIPNIHLKPNGRLQMY